MNLLLADSTINNVGQWLFLIVMIVAGIVLIILMIYVIAIFVEGIFELFK